MYNFSDFQAILESICTNRRAFLVSESYGALLGPSARYRGHAVQVKKHLGTVPYRTVLNLFAAIVRTCHPDLLYVCLYARVLYDRSFLAVSSLRR